jgi:hypothetical protein
MTNLAQRATVVVVALSTVMVAGRVNAQDDSTAADGPRNATIALRVFNYASLSQDVLNVATKRVSLVFERIGVRIVWVDGGPALHILLLSRDIAEKKISSNRITHGVLGQAHLSGKRASIFCDRIAATPGGLTFFSISLGDVIAHEVGHLLLGANSHSRTGIMRANIDVRGLLLQSFDETQARTIRMRLLEPTAFTARR